MTQPISNQSPSNRPLSEERLTFTLEQLASANKHSQWIHADLSVSSSSITGRFFWFLLTQIPIFGKTIRNSLFNTDLEKARNLLLQIKPQIDELKDEDLKNIYKRAVRNFVEIAPNHQRGLENINLNTSSLKKVHRSI
jgi:hypothetical protein